MEPSIEIIISNKTKSVMRRVTKFLIIPLCLLSLAHNPASAQTEKNMFRLFGASEPLIELYDKFEIQKYKNHLNAIVIGTNILRAAEQEFGDKHVSIWLMHLQLAVLKVQLKNKSFVEIDRHIDHAILIQKEDFGGIHKSTAVILISLIEWYLLDGRNRRVEELLAIVYRDQPEPFQIFLGALVTEMKQAKDENNNISTKFPNPSDLDTARHRYLKLLKKASIFYRAKGNNADAEKLEKEANSIKLAK